MPQWGRWGLMGLFLCLAVGGRAVGAEVEVGIAEVEVTPAVGGAKKVYLAGFGQNRAATGVRDPLLARAVVLRHEGKKIALACVDVVGLFQEPVERIRKALPGFSHVLVSSTHNHEGPDTMGLWGPNPFTSGVDRDYLAKLEQGVVAAVQAADRAARPVRARIGTAAGPELLHDGREPHVLHDEMVVLEFRDPGDAKTVGLLVQWNCHPETLGDKNTQVSADYVGHTVRHLREKYHCPVAYFTGTVGGLMTSLKVPVKDEHGKLLPEDSPEKNARYGRLVGELAERAVQKARPVTLTPLEARTRAVYLPLYNPTYKLARQLGILKREAYVWTGDPDRAEPVQGSAGGKALALRTEVGLLRLGDVQVAAIPGEIYPELVLGKVQDPADPGADFPDAPVEPSIYGAMTAKHKMIVGLANDEIGYILPKRQWDEKAPYCYGRKKAQYGEGNSVGPETGPILCRAFRELAGKKE